MANNLKERDEKKETENILLTAEEYAKQERLKRKERINRVTRVAGVFAILLIAFEAILDPLFELTYFGWIWDKIAKTTVFTDAWVYFDGSGIFDDRLVMDLWIGKLGITILYVGVVLLLVYFITYCIVDLVELCRTLYKSGKDITKDLFENIKDTVDESDKDGKVDRPNRSKKNKKSLFDKDETADATDGTKKKKEKKSRKKENENEEYSNGLSSNQLDDLLSGKDLNDVINPVESIDNSNVVGTKPL